MGEFTLNSFNEVESNYYTNKPKEVEGLNNASYIWWYNHLQDLLFSIFDFENLPKEWNTDFLKQNLFENGFICVSKVKGLETPLALPCSYHGLNYYGFPVEYTINNPVLGSFNGKLEGDNKTGVLVYLQFKHNRFKSYIPLITHYAVMLASCDCSINVSLMNSRVAHVFEVSNEAERQSVMKMYDVVSQGKPVVFLKKGKIDRQLYETNNEFMNVKNTYIANDILLTQSQIYDMFLTEIGINNANTNKRERLVTDEVNANNLETKMVIHNEFKTLKECIDKVNESFNLNIKIKLHYEELEGGNNNESKQPDEVVR